MQHKVRSFRPSYEAYLCHRYDCARLAGQASHDTCMVGGAGGNFMPVLVRGLLQLEEAREKVTSRVYDVLPPQADVEELAGACEGSGVKSESLD